MAGGGAGVEGTDGGTGVGRAPGPSCGGEPESSDSLRTFGAFVRPRGVRRGLATVAAIVTIEYGGDGDAWSWLDSPGCPGDRDRAGAERL
ncbi:hypothetical protein SVIO_037390 [Streptomyces violaceusniger]|uniref:Uncharacterized protein n=1 Tax=Streptomyces violaceusniger TaxID=68280 RepID=A0A4D4L1S7_STRVO|nr:hypothetical protein SVIO_037390 [Streptomyces violaceusniger]